jgi:hypothetical protein
VGHIRLGVLPRSRKWQQVVEQLRLGADASAAAASAAGAAEASLQGASHDPAFLHSFWLLTQIPLMAAFGFQVFPTILSVDPQPPPHGWAITKVWDRVGHPPLDLSTA